MKRTALFLLMIFSLIVIVSSAQEATEEPGPCDFGEEYDEERGDCVETGRIEITITTPQWINEYPIADDLVTAFVAQQRITFLTSIFQFRPDEPLYFDFDYEEVRYGNILASLLFRVEYDFGDVTPLSEIRTFTFDLEEGVPVELEELMLPNANPVSTFGPLVPQEAVDEGFVSLVSGGLDDPALFENWVLSDEGITFYYPPFREGSVDAGEFSVFLPMDVAGPVLILPEDAPEATEEAE